jgi:hypothetical protein
MSENKDKKSILDRVKDLEVAKKQRVLIKNIQKLKELCADVIETKEEVNILLEKLGISKEEGKALIDFLNESDDVKMVEDKRKEIEERVEKELKQDKSKVADDLEKALEKEGYVFATLGNYGAISQFNCQTIPTSAASSINFLATSQDKMTLSNGNSQIDLKI